MINVRYHSQNTKFHDYTVKLITQIKEQTIKEFLINKSIKQATRLGLLIFFYISFSIVFSLIYHENNYKRLVL